MTLQLEKAISVLESSPKDYQESDFLEEKLPLGEGGVGTVFLRKTIHNESFAVKVLTAGKCLVDHNQLNRIIEKEVNTLKSLSHQNIVKMIGTYKSTDSLDVDGIVFEYHSEGTLERALMGKWEGRINTHLIYDQRLMLHWMVQLANALIYIHSLDLVHNDLKPDNILMAGNYQTLKVSDLGSTRRKDVTANSSMRTLRYKAPLRKTLKPDPKDDVYSAGLILWQMVFRKKPYHEYTDENQIPFAVERRGERPSTKGCNEILKTMMERCWSPMWRFCWTSQQLYDHLIYYLNLIFDKTSMIMTVPVFFSGIALTPPAESGLMTESSLLPPSIEVGENTRSPIMSEATNREASIQMENRRPQGQSVQVGAIDLPMPRDLAIGIEAIDGIFKVVEKVRRDLRGPNGSGRGPNPNVEKTFASMMRTMDNLYRETTPRAKWPEYEYQVDEPEE